MSHFSYTPATDLHSIWFPNSKRNAITDSSSISLLQQQHDNAKLISEVSAFKGENNDEDRGMLF